MKTFCGADCSKCSFQEECKGCVETGGRPFGAECIAAECFKAGGQECFDACKAQLLKEFNVLAVEGMPEATDLVLLRGAFVNLEYTLPNGQKVKLLDDDKIYLGYQLEKEAGDRCFGLAADREYLLVCEYGCDGADPEIIVYKKRSAE